MKTRNLLPAILLITLVWSLFSCSKDEETQPAQPVLPSGNPVNPYSNTVHGTDFVEFKLDGAQISLNNFTYTPPVLSFGIASITSDPAHPFFPLYQLIGQFRSLPGSSISYIMMHLVDTIPINMSQYVFQGISAKHRFSVSMITHEGNFLLPDANCITTVEFSKLDTIDGGKVEGTFSMSNLNLQDDDENLISGNHSITDGRFSLTFRK
jgi:hypothetical protein